MEMRLFKVRTWQIHRLGSSLVLKIYYLYSSRRIILNILRLNDPIQNIRCSGKLCTIGCTFLYASVFPISVVVSQTTFIHIIIFNIIYLFIGSECTFIYRCSNSTDINLKYVFNCNILMIVFMMPSL